MDENEVNVEQQVEQEPEVEKEPEIEKEVKVAPRAVRPVRRPRPYQPEVSTGFLWFILPLVFVLGLGTGWLLWGGRVPTETADIKRYDVAEAGNPAIGPADAPVKIIEFSDYQCPYCKRWYDTVNARLLADYAGKIRFVYRDLPLSSIHPEAQGAAEAADCAGEQNVYWQYHDALFEGKYGLGAQAYPLYAADLGLDVNVFNTCVAERRYQSEVENDAQVGIGLGLNGTPTFFVNGLKLVGAQPYEVFQQIIDKELAGQTPKN
jgi:protein-disulfide isomerase